MRVVSAKIKEDFVTKKQQELWENVSNNILKITNQKLNLNMYAVPYINIPLNTIMAGKLDMN